VMTCGVTIITSSLSDLPFWAMVPRITVWLLGILTVVATVVVSNRGERIVLPPSTAMGMPSFSGPT
jgi:hypothetical protein